MESSDDVTLFRAVPFHLKPQGPGFETLEVLRSSHWAFRKVLDCRLYCLANTRPHRRHIKVSRARKHVKDMKTAMSTFDSGNPTIILHFLPRFVEEFELENVSKAQACLFTRIFLKMNSLDHFLAFWHASTRDGLLYWPEYVNYLLSTYAANSAIRKEVINFMALPQSPRQTKLEFSNKVNIAAYRCENAFSLDDKILIYVCGLKPAIRIIVAHKVKEFSDERRIFENVVQIAQKEGEANWARLTKPKASRTGSFLSQDHEINDNSDDDLMMMICNRGNCRGHPRSCERSKEVPRIPPMRKRPYKRDRPGWIKQNPHRADVRRTRGKICHQCYARAHYSFDCALLFWEWDVLIDNLKKLSVRDRERILHDTYAVATFASNKLARTSGPCKERTAQRHLRQTWRWWIEQIWMHVHDHQIEGTKRKPQTWLPELIAHLLAYCIPGVQKTSLCWRS